MELPPSEEFEVLIDLGAITVETRGGPDFIPEFSCERPVDGLVED
ncbi:hypothetical protein [Caulobacter sp. FWC26]|nr:hypothetical protein [Caulobacter sp. FWC26]